MPTFRNDGERSVTYNSPDGKDIIIFDPGKNVQLVHWVPYKKLGLTLVSESYPPVPNAVLISDNFKFSQGMERRFDIEQCKRYSLDIYPVSGSVKIYLGASKTAQYLSTSSEYHAVFDWQIAPYIIIVGGAGGADIDIQATLKE